MAEIQARINAAVEMNNSVKSKSMSLDLDKLQADKRASSSSHEPTTPRDVITTPTEQVARSAAKRYDTRACVYVHRSV